MTSQKILFCEIEAEYEEFDASSIRSIPIIEEPSDEQQQVSIHNKKRKVRTFAAPKRVRKKLRMMREQRAQYFSSGMFDFDNSSNDDDDLDFFDDAFALHHASYISQSVSYSNDVDGENVTRTTASCKVKNGTTTQEHVTVERKLGNTRLVTHASRDAQSGQVVVTSKQN